MKHIVNRVTPDQPLTERLDRLVAFLDVLDPDPLRRAAVDLADNDLLRNVDQAAGQVPRVRGTQRRIGKPLTRAARRNEVFEHRKPLAEVGFNRDFDGFTRRRCHQAAHTRQLADLVDAAARTRIRHHMDRVIPLLLHILLKQPGHFLRGVLPLADDQTITFIVGNKAALVLFVDLRNFFLGFVDEHGLLVRYKHIGDCNRQRALSGIFIAHALDRVKHLGSLVKAVLLDAAVNNAAELLFAAGEHDFKVDQMLPIAFNKAQVLRDAFVEDQPPGGRVDNAGNLLAIRVMRTLIGACTPTTPWS